MAKQTKSASMKYADRITMSTEAIEAQQVETWVEQSKLNLQQGCLSIKGQLITAQADVSKATAALNRAKATMEAAKSNKPLNVQGIINYKKAIEQAQLDVEANQEAVNNLQDMLNYLEDLEKELF